MEQREAQKQTSRRQNSEQERGRAAWQDIKEIKDKKDQDLEKKYRSSARGLNAMIQINGLGQTLGFFSAKAKGKRKDNQQAEFSKTEYYYLSEHLTNWMRGHFATGSDHAIGEGYNGLLNWVINEKTTSADYRRATTECLAFGVWLRRFAEAELEGEES